MASHGERLTRRAGDPDPLADREAADPRDQGRLGQHRPRFAHRDEHRRGRSRRADRGEQPRQHGLRVDDEVTRLLQRHRADLLDRVARHLGGDPVGQLAAPVVLVRVDERGVEPLDERAGHRVPRGGRAGGGDGGRAGVAGVRSSGRHTVRTVRRRSLPRSPSVGRIHPEELAVRVNLMIEGQEDVSWGQWMALARAVEASGLEGLFRSDHYQSVAAHTDRGALDAWTTLAALGQVTDRIRLGTMVSPTSFRHPSVLAKSAVTADHVSGGRVELGIGAGWHDLEHRTYGFPFHDLGTRYEVFEEQVEIIARQLREDRFDFEGRHYTLLDCEARPKPVQERLPIIIGGSGGPRSVAIAARWADEYNTVFPSLDEVGRTPRPARAGLRGGRSRPARVLDDDRVRDRRGRGRGRRSGTASARALRQRRRLRRVVRARRDVWLVGTVDEVGSRLDDVRAGRRRSG
jgi:alkanesulfonate monooxygenase SsuD/methylene tetrahydromethanopterin reductase-like flavin-dependent oxidoreductase (luciferase family)